MNIQVAPSLDQLPYLKDIFTALRRGKHICMEDTLLYGALEKHYEHFKSLFDALGLQLVHHQRGIFYMVDDSAPSAAESIVYFMAILIESMDDRGASIQDAIERSPRKVFLIEDLPHLTMPKYQDLMRGVLDVKDRQGVQRIIASMTRYGFVEALDGGAFRFRQSAFRLLDVCALAGVEADSNARAAVDEEAPAEDAKDMPGSCGMGRDAAGVEA
ncbi:MAG: hypothetical protein HYZ13_03055 [Acidobacteria bacterium]|nr:hypothetical protein [Acidobacteriota bacterium]